MPMPHKQTLDSRKSEKQADNSQDIDKERHTGGIQNSIDQRQAAKKREDSGVFAKRGFDELFAHANQ